MKFVKGNRYIEYELILNRKYKDTITFSNKMLEIESFEFEENIQYDNLNIIISAYGNLNIVKVINIKHPNNNKNIYFFIQSSYTLGPVTYTIIYVLSKKADTLKNKFMHIVLSNNLSSLSFKYKINEEIIIGAVITITIINVSNKSNIYVISSLLIIIGINLSIFTISNIITNIEVKEKDFSYIILISLFCVSILSFIICTIFF